MKVSKQELEAVTALSPEKRYNYFVKRICDWEQVWTLYEDNYIVLNEAKNGKLYIVYPYKPKNPLIHSILCYKLFANICKFLYLYTIILADIYA